MKKIVAILTHWSIPNYGSFLQAYALQKFIGETYPQYDVKQIAYMNPVHAKMYYGYEMHEIYRLWAINPHFYQDIIKRIKSIQRRKNLLKFKEFYLTSISHTEELNSRQLEKTHFDTVILGSDILWDYSIPFYNYDPYVFGNSINADKIISYAASFGTVKPGSLHPEYVKNGIKKLDAISVRDINSAQICEELTDAKVSNVLDPTMLWHFTDDPNIKQIDLGFNYIVVYGSFFTKDQIKFIRQFASEKNLKIICLDSFGDHCDWCDYFLPIGSISPFEWCSYIKASEYLMTCTFHGLMFGLIYNKRILFNATSFIRDKSVDFITYLGLEEVLLNGSDFEESMSYKWDYSRINCLINSKRKESVDYLMKNI